MDDYDGPIPSSEEDSDISLETRPPPQVSDSVISPPTKPARSADIPPDPAPRPPERPQPSYYTELSVVNAQEQAIRRWELSRRPEYGTLDRRTRSFYQDPGRWDAKGKPSVESIAAARFYYDGRSKTFTNSHTLCSSSTTSPIFPRQRPSLYTF